LVEKQHKYIYQKKFVDPYRNQYIMAREYFDKKDYGRALPLLNKFIENVPGNLDGHQLRAYIYYYQNDYRKSIEEIEYVLTLKDNNTGAIINLRGICYRDLNDLEASCKDFEKAMKMGNADGKTNWERFCNKQTPSP